jgi:serine/threonine protein kinase
MESEKKDEATKPIEQLTTQAGSEPVTAQSAGVPFEYSLVPGALINDRYRIEKELGRGGVGITYLARDQQLYAMQVVIKVLIEKSGGSEWVKKKFIQETEALTRISHPGVVKVLNRGEFPGGKLYFVMEFVEGQPLRSAITPEGMDFEYVAQILQDLGNALNAAHQKKIIHRDLKPENIMLQTLSDGEEAVKIIDFGIAKVTDSQLGNTTEGHIIAGSLNYMAPEQLLSQPISTATDIYALGVIAHEMLTGRRPFNADAKQLLASMRQLLDMQREGVEIKPKQLRPSLPHAAQEILLTALAYEPQNRPQDARKFCEDLAHSLTEPVADFPPDWQRSPKTSLMDPAKTDPIIPARKTRPPYRPERPYENPEVDADSETVIENSGAAIAEEAKGEAAKEVNTGSVIEGANRFLQPLPLLGLMAALAIIGLLIWQVFKPKPPVINVPPRPEEAVAPAKPEINLSYFLTVQRDPKRFAGSKPFQLDREMIFGDDDLVRFTFIAPQDGYLYIFNESPAPQGSDFSILFPTPTTNQGSSRLSAAQQIQIPEKWFTLVKDEGTEKLWIVWARASLEKLEVMKKWANRKDLGEIKDAGQVTELKSLLASQTGNPPTIEKNEAQKQTTLKQQGDLLVKMIPLEHH